MNEAEKIAAWIVETGCQQTSNGNYIIFHDEILQTFGVNLSTDTNLKAAIVQKLEARPEVLDTYSYGEYIDVIFGLNHCQNISEDIWREVEPLPLT